MSKKPLLSSYGQRPSFLDPPVPKGPSRGIRILTGVAIALAIGGALLRVLVRWAG